MKEKTSRARPAKTPAASHVARHRSAAPPAKRKRRSPADILNRIVRAAAEEFKRCGYTGAATAAIARRADVTEAQLFRYFGSKSNLFRETIFNPLERHLREFLEQHAPSLDRDTSARDARLYTTELQRFISAHSQILTSLMVAQMYDSGTSHRLSGIDSLSTYFDRGAAMMTSQLKGEVRVDPKLMVRAAFAAVLACVLFKDWIFPAGLASDAQITDAINCFVMQGINANPHKGL